MKTALHIILAKIMEALTFHPHPAFCSIDEFCESWNKQFRS